MATKKLNNNYNKFEQPFGLWWIQWDDGEYYIHQSTDLKELFGHDSGKGRRKIFSKKWDEIANKVIELNPEHKTYVDDIKVMFKGLTEGKYDSYKNNFPWLSQNGELIWIENQLTVVYKNRDGLPILIVGSSNDVTDRILMRQSIDSLEESNERLESANNRAIKLANILVWSIDHNLHPNGEYFLANKVYMDTLGLTPNEDGYVSSDAFAKTFYPDLEGRESFNKLLYFEEKSKNNEIDEFMGILVKHQNIKTGEVVYLEHHTKVDKRREDGTALELGGYVIDVTAKMKMEQKNQKLAMENEQLSRAHQLAVKSGKVMIWYIDSTTMEDKYFYGNDMMATKLGLKNYGDNMFLKTDFDLTIYLDDEEGKMMFEEYYNHRNKAFDGDIDSFEKIVVKHQNLQTNEILYLEHNFESDKRYDDGRLMVRGGFIDDITNEYIVEKRNKYLMNYDEMTDLRNRNSFERFISSGQLPKSYVLVIVDIDGLKFINDAFGHLMGDKAIAFTAQLLKDKFPSYANIFRIGGDEYAIIVQGQEYEKVEMILIEIKKSLEEFYIENNIHINISYGFEPSKADCDFYEIFVEAENLMYRRKLDERSSRKSRTMQTVLETLNQKTEETIEHCERMGTYAVKLMKRLGYNRGSDFDDMKLLCRVHDIGKITVSESLLSKKGKLTKEEYAKIQKHAEAGYKIIRNIVDSDEIAYGVLYHHEKVDGSGYPFGIKGDKIPMFAKILSVVDAYDVMTNGRVYTKPKTFEEVVEEFNRCSGTQFDKNVVSEFIDILEKEKQ